MWCNLLIWVIPVLMAVKEIEAQHERRYIYHRRQAIRPIGSSGLLHRSESVHTGNKTSEENVDVDVYYETNCPDSMRFITKQLYPVYQEMKDILNICLIPYGKAREKYSESSKRYDFHCQHGPDECYGNTIQSCAISLYPKLEDHLNFINCMENYPFPSSSGEKCARKTSLDWKKIGKCAEGELGNALLYENGKLTKSLNPSFDFVPWVVINKIYTPEVHKKSLENFKQVICDHVNNEHPRCAQF